MAGKVNSFLFMFLSFEAGSHYSLLILPGLMFLLHGKTLEQYEDNKLSI